MTPEKPETAPDGVGSEAPEPSDAPILPANVRPFTPRMRQDPPLAETVKKGVAPEIEANTQTKPEPVPVVPQPAITTYTISPQPHTSVALKNPPVLSVAANNMKPLAGLSALELLALKRRKPASQADGAQSEGTADAQGEAPDLQMDVEVDEKGELVLRTLGARKESPESLDEAQTTEYGAANRAMAEEEQNILRHHDDYDAYQHMDEHHEPGGFER